MVQAVPSRKTFNTGILNLFQVFKFLRPVGIYACWPDGVVMKDPPVQIIPSLAPPALGIPCAGGIGFIALRLVVGPVLSRVVLGLVVIPGPIIILG